MEEFVTSSASHVTSFLLEPCLMSVPVFAGFSRTSALSHRATSSTSLREVALYNVKEDHGTKGL